MLTDLCCIRGLDKTPGRPYVRLLPLAQCLSQSLTRSANRATACFTKPTFCSYLLHHNQILVLVSRISVTACCSGSLLLASLGSPTRKLVQGLRKSPSLMESSVRCLRTLWEHGRRIRSHPSKPAPPDPIDPGFGFDRFERQRPAVGSITPSSRRYCQTRSAVSCAPLNGELSKRRDSTFPKTSPRPCIVSALPLYGVQQASRSFV